MVGPVPTRTVCDENEVSIPPDSSTDCLWTADTIWQSKTPRSVDVKIEATGNHDLKIELEDENGTFQVLRASAAPALPTARVTGGKFDDIVSISVKCEKSPVNPCSNCEYKYKICYSTELGFVSAS